MKSLQFLFPQCPEIDHRLFPPVERASKSAHTFSRESLFRVAPRLNEKAIEKLFRVKVLAMLLRKKKISPELIRILDGWRHSGFTVCAGGRMRHSPEQATVLYRSNSGKEKRTYNALEWLAGMACHVPERG